MASDRGGLLFAAGWSLLLALLLLGPALGPGYVLAYDMVWVPDLALRRAERHSRGSLVAANRADHSQLRKPWAVL